jgi:hypothetical protein
MRLTEKHILHFNSLHGQTITRGKLKKFHDALRADITAKRIDAHVPGGVECIDILKRLSSAIHAMNGKYKKIEKLSVQRVKVPKVVIPPVVKKKPKVAPKPKPVPKQTPKHAAAPKPATPTPAKVVKNLSGIFGFTTADEVPAESGDTFTLPGEIGKLLGNLQRYKLEIVVSGETHSSKSEMAKQIGDAFVGGGFKTAYIDWEQGGMKSKDTDAGMKRNVSDINRKKLFVSPDKNGHELPRTLEAIKSLHRYFEVVVIDSGTKLKQITNSWIDELREQYPNVIWVPVMQQNEKGGTRGGSAAEFDAPVVIKTYRPDRTDFTKNYAEVVKNRGNKTGLFYNIASKQIISDPTLKKAEPAKAQRVNEPYV